MFLFALIASLPLIHSAQEISDWIPKSESDVERVAEISIQEFQEKLGHFLNITPEERTFDNTIRDWDYIYGNLEQTIHCLSGLLQIHPEKAVRDSLNLATQKLTQTLIDSFAKQEIYNAFLIAEAASSSLSPIEQYYVERLITSCRYRGMHLPEEQRHLLNQTMREISSLESRFHRNISEDSSVLYVPKEELAGLDDCWIFSREHNEGVFKLNCDLPTYTAVLANCTNRNTRLAMYELFSNRAYPQNEEVIKQLIAKRDQLAKLLGYSSYAEYDLSSQMAESPEKVQAFLSLIKLKAARKSDLEFTQVTEELPEDILLNSSKIERFDEFYVYDNYKKKHFSVNDNKIAEYFPLEKTLQGLITIFELFFDLSIKEVEHTIAIPDLKALEVRDHSEQLLGVVLLDLFPRPGKAAHKGICYSLSRAFSPPGGPNYPAVSLVIGNFTKPTHDQPSLMRHAEVTTLFHEFGHAIHCTFGRNEFLGFCGMRVKRDFVELPSQLLEEWMWDSQILKLISSHYLTREPLPDPLIQNMILAKDFGIGTEIMRSCYFSELSLALFSDGEEKNPTQIAHELWASELPHSYCRENNHFHASWWHIPGYGSKYYSYLWSKVFALDLFEKIRQEGLLNPKAGKEYAQAILSKGGSQDPNQMLFDYLGRKPSLEPFLKQLED